MIEGNFSNIPADGLNDNADYVSEVTCPECGCAFEITILAQDLPAT